MFWTLWYIQYALEKKNTFFGNKTCKSAYKISKTRKKKKNKKNRKKLLTTISQCGIFNTHLTKKSVKNL